MPTLTPKQKKLVNPLLFILGTILLAVLAWGGYTLYRNSTVNYAEEVAKPLEEGLMKAGGVKKTSGGDAGRGIDNVTPHYQATYYLNLDKAEAIALIHKITQDNGYTLTHATPNNRGHLTAVADMYIDAWYFDITNKHSTIRDLQEGTIKLAVKIGGENEPDPAGHTTIGIGVELPDLRR